MATTWTKGIKRNTKPKFSGEKRVDVLIVGGGLTGINTAYLLSKEGKEVMLIEKDEIGGTATSRTTAFLTCVIDTDLRDLVKVFGREKAKQVWRSHQKAVDEYGQIIENEKIECEFVRCENLMFAASEKDFEQIEEDALFAREFGFDMTEKEKGDHHFLRFGFASLKGQAKFHPLKYIKALVEKAQKNGVEFFEHTEAQEVNELEDGSVEVKTDQGTITAKYLITATHDPFYHPKEIFAHKGKYISYIVELEVPKGKFEEAIYEDTNNPYYYFRIDQGEKTDRMILGGADHRHEIPIDSEKNFKALEDYFKKQFPDIPYKEVERWSGPIFEPLDGLAYIGKLSMKKGHQLVATGFSGNGMTYAMLSAIIFRDTVLGKGDQWIDLYNPNRSHSLKSLWQKGVDYVEELVLGAGKNIFKRTE